MLHRARFEDANPLERLKEQLLFMKQETATEVYMTRAEGCAGRSPAPGLGEVYRGRP